MNISALVYGTGYTAPAPTVEQSAATAPRTPTFGDLLRHHLETAGIGYDRAASLWSLGSARAVGQLVAGHTLPHPDTAGWWSDVMERPQSEIQEALNVSRVRAGLDTFPF